MRHNQYSQWLECETFRTIFLKCLLARVELGSDAFLLNLQVEVLLDAGADVELDAVDAELDAADVEAFGGATDDAPSEPPLGTEVVGGAPPEETEEGKGGGVPNAGVITPTADARFEIGGPGNV